MLGQNTTSQRLGWTGTLWNENVRTYEAILEHPFIQGLTSGNLEPAAFLRFLSQDAHYVREYVRALTALASKAPDYPMVGMLIEHAAGGVAAESALHAALVEDLGADIAELELVEPTPTTEAYVNYIGAKVHGGSFVEGLASVLPCMWVYAEVGAHLVSLGSPNPVYQRWIDNYAGDSYAAEVRAMLDLVDALEPDLGRAELEGASAAFAMAGRYEWMFWDSAFAGEAWPLA